ncbi:MAG TPA: DUF692 domain-containing protein [Bryobacteraceae bacterium]
MYSNLPQLGVGLGYRMPLHNDLLANRHTFDFLELINDQFIFSPLDKQEQILRDLRSIPLVAHGVAMSVGTAQPLDQDYLQATVAFVDHIRAPWFSDHLCFTKTDLADLGQLTPVWFTEETLAQVISNVMAIKRACPAVPFLLENITYYFPLPGSEMTEAEFISRVLVEADCGLLLDVNNVFINSQNLGFDPYDFLTAIPLERVVQVHIAGHKETPGLIIDTHDRPMTKDVWDILSFVVARAPVKAVSLEWDSSYPAFSVIEHELACARSLYSHASPCL